MNPKVERKLNDLREGLTFGRIEVEDNIVRRSTCGSLAWI